MHILCKLQFTAAKKPFIASSRNLLALHAAVFSIMLSKQTLVSGQTVSEFQGTIPLISAGVGKAIVMSLHKF